MSEVQEVIAKDKWFVDFPTFRYQEDVKKLARDNRLVVVDAKFKNDPIGNFAAAKVPEITLKAEYQPKKKAGKPGPKAAES